MKYRELGRRTPADEVRPLTPAELLRCHGGGEHEGVWFWQILWEPPDSPIDPLTGTGPTRPY